MTKFILNGGSGGLSTDKDFQFWRMVGAVNKPNVSVLSIGFACGDPANNHFWELQTDLADEVNSILSWVNPHKAFNVEAADIIGPTFITQMNQADVIFVHGGNGDKLQHILRPLLNREQLKRIQIVAGGSAGTNCWVDSYYSNDNKKVCEGLGFVPVKTFCHYTSMKWDRLNELRNTGRDLPVIPLFEGEFITYDIKIK